MNEFTQYKLSYERFLATARQHLFACEARSCSCQAGVETAADPAGCGAMRQRERAGL